MCQVCHATPCLSRCPNAGEAKPVAVCKICGEWIWAGEKMLAFNVMAIRIAVCKDCVEEKTTIAGED